jgi:hypothetical protein
MLNVVFLVILSVMMHCSHCNIYTILLQTCNKTIVKHLQKTHVGFKAHFLLHAINAVPCVHLPLFVVLPLVLLSHRNLSCQ